MKFLIVLAFVLSLTTLTASAQANESSAGKSVSQAPSSITDSIYASYFGNYHGATLGSISSPNTVDKKGNLSGRGMFFDSEVNAGYKLSQSSGVGLVVPFFITPVQGGDLTLGDVGVKAFENKTISASGVTVATNLILQAPTSTSSQDRGMTFAVKTTPNIRYSIPDSRFTIGSWTEAKAYLGVTKDKTFKLYAEPYVSYQTGSKTALSLAYEMEAHHNVGDTGALNFTNYQTDLQPGFIWFVSKKVLVNPYLQLFTGNKVTADTTAVGAIISASL